MRRTAGGAAEHLPDSLLFGVATSDHQCEAYREDCPDIQDLWEEARNLTKRERATDFWNRYEEDIQLAADMGCRLFRISLSWARLEPEPGRFDVAAFDHYRDVISAIRAQQMEPMVTLHHYTWPVHIEKRGGSISPDFPALFEAYAAEAVRRLGDLVTYWITFNEPNQLVYGYFKAGDYHLPPGLPPGTSTSEQMYRLSLLIPNLFRANAKARQVIKTAYPDAKVGANPFLLGLPAWSRRFVDYEITKAEPQEWQRHGKIRKEHSLRWPGQADIVVAALSVTPDRQQEIDFSEVYYTDRVRLLVLANSKDGIKEDLANGKVAVIKGSTSVDVRQQQMPSTKAKVCADMRRALQLLERGEVMALLADETQLRGAVHRYPGRYRLVDIPLNTSENKNKNKNEEEYGNKNENNNGYEEHYAVGIPKGNILLRDAVDIAVERFRELEAEEIGSGGELPDGIEPPAVNRARSQHLPRRRVLSHLSESEIHEKHAPARRSLRSAEEGTGLRKIQDRGYLIAAVRDDAPGMAYRDPETGEYQGLEIELCRLIAEVIFGDRSRVKFHSVHIRHRISHLRSPFGGMELLLHGLQPLFTIFNSDWWNLGMAGKLPEFLCPAGCAHQLDYVGLDYYWGTNHLWPARLARLNRASKGMYTGAPVWPEGLYELLKLTAELLPDLEIFVVENGCVPEADKVTREKYLRDHIAQIARAVEAGVNVRGYICWSITSNREWGFKFTKDSDFGIYHIDLESDPNLARTPTSTAQVYKEIIANFHQTIGNHS